ncbi:uncharacterized protein LOC123037142 [Drosophila rhopaloa]|uniref:Reverse transcriptase domain-containing protein n=1 Tax=Drosophila rhopaloa TaxID=1041015 RepID=A0ABM5J175_DRORH|nr:uncharacterized protein LOC123037142 [Drosophila rhopaloa]
MVRNKNELSCVYVDSVEPSVVLGILIIVSIIEVINDILTVSISIDIPSSPITAGSSFYELSRQFVNSNHPHKATASKLRYLAVTFSWSISQTSNHRPIPKRNIAMGQYARLYKTLLKDEAINLEYSRVLQEYIDLGHMTEVPPMEIIQKNQYLSFYLPHHAVVRPESPVLQGDLLGILLNWRLYKFVFNGDIEKMYRQILVHPDDRPFQRLIFRPKQSAIMKDFQLNTVTFGVNCAPFLAIRTLQQLATDCKEKYPRTSQILLQETYVDDILAGAHTLEDAKNAQSQLIASLKSAGFLLKKNTANHIKLLENIAVADRLDTEFLEVPEATLFFMLKTS